MFTLAHFFFESPVAPQALLFTASDNAKADASYDAVRVEAGSTVSFDTYFNSFYERYWRRYTGIKHLAFVADVEGQARITLMRVNGFGDETVIAQIETSGGDVELLAPPPRFSDAECGRLYVVVEALAAPVTISHARWVTNDEPLRDAKFELVTPTAFGREAFLGPSVERLLASKTLAPVLQRCILINQSGVKLENHPAFGFMAQKKMAARVSIVEQGNYGSTGGYTRGVIEMLAAPQATHVLFMDDDAQVEAEPVYRAYAFARYVSEPCIVGGHMLDLIRPHMLYEAANTTQLGKLSVYNPLIQDGGEGVDARERSVRDMFTSVLESHYNAWWLCAIPRSVFERMGLPLPFFVRGDDVSLGLRAREHGIATISLPGMAIWHEPFSMKPGGFKEYYIIRNMLVNATLHAGGSALGFIMVLWARFAMHLLRFDYALAALTERGLSDFMKGPSQLTFDGAANNQEIINTMKAWSTAKPMPRWILPTRNAGLRPKLNPQIIVNMALRALYNMCIPSKVGESDVQKHIFDVAIDLNYRWEVPASVFANTAVVSNPYAPQSFLHVRDFWKFWTLMARMAGASARLLLQYGALRSKWLKGAKDLSATTFWQSYLKLGHKAVAPEASETRPKAA